MSTLVRCCWLQLLGLPGKTNHGGCAAKGSCKHVSVEELFLVFIGCPDTAMNSCLHSLLPKTEANNTAEAESGGWYAIRSQPHSL